MPTVQMFCDAAIEAARYWYPRFMKEWQEVPCVLAYMSEEQFVEDFLWKQGWRPALVN